MPIAIIGAGAAGCAAAYALREHDAVTVFEKSRGASGRAATRHRHGVTYDHGANYITPTDRVRHLLAVTLGGEGLSCITRPVWTFDRHGHRRPGDRPYEKKWAYRDGINQMGKQLLARSAADMVTETRITALSRVPGGWHLTSEDGRHFGPFEACLITPPAPQAAALIEASEVNRHQSALAALLRSVTFHPQFSIVLGFDQALDRPEPFYALVNTDGKHEMAWLAFEADKQGHVPEGQDVLVAQMSPAWTTAHFDVPHPLLVADVHRIAGRLLSTSLPPTAWADVQRWRYARPQGGLDRARLHALAPHGLYFAGDYLAGKGQIALALESGLDAAAALTSRYATF